MIFSDDTLIHFSESLASKRSVPGGGAAAAYTASLAAALGEMVLAFTIGKPKYEPDRDILEKCASELKKARLAMLKTIDEDAVAFEPLSKAYGLPKNTPEEIAYRETVMEKCLRSAANPPAQLVMMCKEMAPVLKCVSDKGSPIMRSDAGCAALLFESAIQCAAMNVMINTRLMKDRAYADQLNNSVNEAQEEALPVFRAISDKTKESLL